MNAAKGPLMDLADRWRRQARRKFMDADREKRPEGKRALEHCAMCVSNCADDLMEVLTFLSLEPSATEKGGQK